MNKVKMFKRAALVAIGFFPLMLFGSYLHHLILTVFYDRMLPLFLIGVAVIAVWFVFGIISMRLVGSRREAVLLLNAPAFFVLLLVLFQEWVISRFWLNTIGLATQMFYLPLVRLGMVITTPLPLGSFGIASTFAFAFMLGASYLGSKILRV